MMIEESSEREGNMATNGKWTVLDGDRHYKRIDWGPAALPPCDAHLIDGSITCEKDGEFDSPTIQGPWANLCSEHAELFSPKQCYLGYHRVQQVRPSAVDQAMGRYSDEMRRRIEQGKIRESER